MQGKIDVALLRREAHTAGLAFKFLTKEPFIAILPTRHRLARHRAVRPQDLARESFVSTARVAPVLRTVIADLLCRVQPFVTITRQLSGVQPTHIWSWSQLRDSIIDSRDRKANSNLGVTNVNVLAG